MFRATVVYDDPFTETVREQTFHAELAGVAGVRMALEEADSYRRTFGGTVFAVSLRGRHDADRTRDLVYRPNRTPAKLAHRLYGYVSN